MSNSQVSASMLTFGIRRYCAASHTAMIYMSAVFLQRRAVVALLLVICSSAAASCSAAIRLLGCATYIDTTLKDLAKAYTAVQVRNPYGLE